MEKKNYAAKQRRCTETKMGGEEGNTLPAPAIKLLGVEKRDREVEITASAVEGTFVVTVARRHFQVCPPEERHRAPL